MRGKHSNILRESHIIVYSGVTMTEPLRKYSSSDVPEYSSYPAEPDRAVVEVTEVAVISEFDAMPAAERSRFDEQGRKIGAALGRLVNKINELTMGARER